MKNHKFQLIRIGVSAPGESVRFSGETDKGYQRLRGVFVALPNPLLEYGASLSLKVGGTDVFDEDHDVRLLSCGQGVAPNQKFFLLEEFIEASGSAFEGKFTDAAVIDTGFPYEAKVFLWLVNENPK